MAVTKETIQQLRERCNAGVMDCKKALTQAKGNMDKAMEILRKQGVETAMRKASRSTKQGCIESYIHAGGKMGALVEINCESDFVAKTDEFKAFVKDVTMQVAALNPLYVKREDVPKKTADKEADRLEEYYREVCLLEQAFVKDAKRTIKDYLTETIARLGENITIRRFARYQLGEE